MSAPLAGVSSGSRYYTGIGSRSTPEHICALMTEIARTLSWTMTLRSGGADGADRAFEIGATNAQIFLPWKGFNNNGSLLHTIPEEAFTVAAAVHPAWDKCSPAAKKLHARNVQQVLGKELDSPSAFVICWTPGAKVTGGTATAIRVAQMHGIRVFNLAAPTDLSIWERVGGKALL